MKPQMTPRDKGMIVTPRIPTFDSSVGSLSSSVSYTDPAGHTGSAQVSACAKPMAVWGAAKESEGLAEICVKGGSSKREF